MKSKEYEFAKMIRVVELASTPEEEKEAFVFAAEAGLVWSAGYTIEHNLPERVRHLEGKRIYHIEWWSLLPKRKTTAYRVILDESNLQYLKRTPNGHDDESEQTRIDLRT